MVVIESASQDEWPANSYNMRGNERADEWCSGPDILSDERVDVHEDNEDHEKKKGRRVKLVELHTQVHAKKGTKPGEPGSSGIPEFVDPISKQRLDEYSRILSEKHVENEENAEIDENGNKSPLDDFDV
ncbi:hypothetical protein Tco_1325545 [Tanacetum coccineum]